MTICADCGRAFRYVPALEPIEWSEVERVLEGEPAYVLGGFEQVRREAPNPNRVQLGRVGRFRNVDRAGTALGLVFALVVLLELGRLVWS